MLSFRSVGPVALILAVSAAAQKPQVANASVEGRVSSLLSGESLRKAQVALRRPEGGVAARTTTGADGQFVLSVQPGKYRLTAERTGYCAMEFGARAPGRPGALLSVDSGQSVKDMDLRLVPLSSIAGRLVDEERDPLPDAMIYCLRRGYSGGKRVFQPAWAGSTDDRGEFRAGGLEPGQYFVVAQARSQAPARQRNDAATPDERYVPTYYPGSADADGAVPITLRPGMDFEGLELTPVRRPVSRVRGRISPYNPESPAKPSIVLTPAPSQGPGFLGTRVGGVRDSQGNFEIGGVAAGLYVITAEWSDGVRRYQGRQTVEVGAGDRDGISLVLAPGSDVAGRVLVTGSGAAPLDRMRIRLAAETPARALPAAGVAAGGTFSFAAVPPDSYTVELSGAPEGAYLESIKVAGVDITRSGVDLTQSGLAGPVEITISTAGGQIDGAVVDSDKNFRWATVALVPDPGRRGASYWYRTAETDQYGRFSLKGIAPGEYKLFAWEDIEGGAYRDPAFLKPFESLAESVSVSRGDRKAVQVKLIESGGAQSQVNMQ